MKINDDKLTAYVNRFLQWPVPASVHPDGIPGKPGRIGTNLLSASEAREMLEYVLAEAQPDVANRAAQDDAYVQGRRDAEKELRCPDCGEDHGDKGGA